MNGVTVFMASYEVELTGKEILYFFLKKKKCPICSEKMKREKDSKHVGEGLYSLKLGKYYHGDHYDVTIFYRCNKCEKIYSISELSGETK